MTKVDLYICIYVCEYVCIYIYIYTFTYSFSQRLYQPWKRYEGKYILQSKHILV